MKGIRKALFASRNGQIIDWQTRRLGLGSSGQKMSQPSIHLVRNVYIYKVSLQQRSPSKHWPRIYCIWKRLYIDWQKRKSSISLQPMLAYGLAYGFQGTGIGPGVAAKWRYWRSENWMKSKTRGGYINGGNTQYIA